MNIVAAATRIALGERLRDMEYGIGLHPRSGHMVVKVPVFSFSKMRGVETILGPEMKSTGEVLGIDETFAGALRKGFIGAGVRLPGSGGRVLVSIADEEKAEAVAVMRRYARSGVHDRGDAWNARLARGSGIACRSDQQNLRRFAARARRDRTA